MSKGKAWAIDHYMKGVIRKLDYIQSKVLLRELQRTLDKPKEPRLTREERVKFKHWLWWKYGPECAYCHRAFILIDSLTIDHIQPRSKGGALRDVQNMALACLGCNRAKGNQWQE